MDQAQSLREYMLRFNGHQQMQKQQVPVPQSTNETHSARVITITSGKGGVGKSNFTLNFALGLIAAGKKVVVLDVDLSTANINILMGVTPRFTLADVLRQRTYIWDVIEKGTGGIEYIAGGLEVEDLLQLDERMLAFFWSQIQALQCYADFILLDTGAGIYKELVDFIIASDETIVVTTPEPTAIADSYAVIKTVLQYTKQVPRFRLVVNRAQNYREAVETSRAMKNACSQFLKIGLGTLGFVMEDVHVRNSVRAQMPFFLSYPNCEASKNIKQIIQAYLPEMDAAGSSTPKGIRGFFEKFLSLGK